MRTSRAFRVIRRAGAVVRPNRCRPAGRCCSSAAQIAGSVGTLRRRLPLPARTSTRRSSTSPMSSAQTRRRADREAHQRAEQEVLRTARRVPRVVVPAIADPAVTRDARSAISSDNTRDASRRAEDFLLCALMGLAGLRVSEVCALDMGDVDERRVLVRAGKGNRRRSVPTDPAIWAALEQHRPAACTCSADDRPARRITRNALEVRISRLARYAGLGRVTPTSCALVRDGGRRDPQAVVVLRDLLGHRSVNTTSATCTRATTSAGRCSPRRAPAGSGGRAPSGAVRAPGAQGDGRGCTRDRRMLHDFNTEFDDDTPGPEALAERVLELSAAATSWSCCRHGARRARGAALPPVALDDESRVLRGRAVRPPGAPTPGPRSRTDARGDRGGARGRVPTTWISARARTTSGHARCTRARLQQPRDQARGRSCTSSSASSRPLQAGPARLELRRRGRGRGRDRDHEPRSLAGSGLHHDGSRIASVSSLTIARPSPVPTPRFAG